MLLDARKIVDEKIEELKLRIKKLKKIPRLVIVRIGDDPASQKYVNNKVKRCSQAGIESEVIHLGENVDSKDVEEIIQTLNEDNDVTGILLQLPIPKHLDENYLTQLINPDKDVDGFTINNMGKLVLGQEGNVACTPYGIITLLKAYGIEIEGKDVLIINRSNIVGKPLTHLFLKENATVTVAHSKTRNLHQKIWNADIVVTAIGRANMFSEAHFSDYTTIVDVSINFDSETGKMCGDVVKADYEKLIEKNCHISPVPNGVGQMTVLSLIEQTVKIAERNQQ